MIRPAPLVLLVSMNVNKKNKDHTITSRMQKGRHWQKKMVSCQDLYSQKLKSEWSEKSIHVPLQTIGHGLW